MRSKLAQGSWAGQFLVNLTAPLDFMRSNSAKTLHRFFVGARLVFCGELVRPPRRLVSNPVAEVIVRIYGPLAVPVAGAFKAHPWTK